MRPDTEILLAVLGADRCEHHKTGAQHTPAIAFNESGSRAGRLALI